jgi:hypothetical protein
MLESIKKRLKKNINKILCKHHYIPHWTYSKDEEWLECIYCKKQVTRDPNNEKHDKIFNFKEEQ